MALIDKSFSQLKSKVNLIDRSFHRDKTSGWKLSLFLDFPSLSFTVYDPESKKLIVLQEFRFEGINDYREYEEKIGELFRKNELLKSPYAEIKAFIYSKTSTIVPSSLFLENEAENLLKIGHEIREFDKVVFDSIPSNNSVNIYAVPFFLLEGLKALFPGIVIQHSSTVLINNAFNLLSKSEGCSLMVNIEPDHFELVVIENNKLLFYNTFRNETSEDFLYFVLYTLEQLHFNPEHVNVILSGQIEQNSLLHNVLRQYIRNISFAPRNLNVEYGPAFNDLENQFYFNLLNSPL